MDRVRVLGRRTRSKSKRYSPPYLLHVWTGGHGQRQAIVLKIMSHTLEKPSQTTAWELEYSYSKRVEIGRRGREISSRHCYGFFYRESWFWNRRFGWRVDAFLFRS